MFSFYLTLSNRIPNPMLLGNHAVTADVVVYEVADMAGI